MNFFSNAMPYSPLSSRFFFLNMIVLFFKFIFLELSTPNMGFELKTLISRVAHSID